MSSKYDSQGENQWATNYQPSTDYPAGGPTPSSFPGGGYGAPYGYSPAATGAPHSRDGFFKALFDFSFSRYITVDFAKVIYIIFMAFIVLTWFIGLFVSLVSFQGGVGVGIFAFFAYLIFGTIFTLFQLIGARLFLEFFVANIKTAQNTSIMSNDVEAKNGV
ncbi:DUF4282 domain-containing protein [Corynebacterium qintianiae]|uniref:DUF4282 domain-containing protein n=1 Tax=Corynebacterium qintianiae TaxID=2709392 RepID=A0A7T0KNP9_9CORY|nr:DUF4282 domain-containing protein [Corynebacterium qintianiae]QPK83649.1 DUF4282 domain-containing protein [Corynebacterium qintianiae]